MQNVKWNFGNWNAFTLECWYLLHVSKWEWFFFGTKWLYLYLYLMLYCLPCNIYIDMSEYLYWVLCGSLSFFENDIAHWKKPYTAHWKLDLGFEHFQNILVIGSWMVYILVYVCTSIFEDTEIGNTVVIMWVFYRLSTHHCVTLIKWLGSMI